MFFCGIDVAQHQHAVVVVDDVGQLVQPAFSIDSSRSAFDPLATALTELTGSVLAGLRAVGHCRPSRVSNLKQKTGPIW
jgi:hypothetical protein